MKINIKKVLQAILFLGVGLTLLYLVYYINNKNFLAQCVQDGIPLDECDLIQKIIFDFSTVSWWWMLPIFAAFLMSNISRAIRWQMLIKPLGSKPNLPTLFFSIMLSYLANMGFPRIGEVVRAGVIAKYSNLPIEKVIGTVILDRLADLIIFFSLCIVVMFFQADRMIDFIETQGIDISGGGIIKRLLILSVVGAVGIFFLRFIVKSTTDNVVVAKIRKLILGFWDGIKTIAQIDKVGWFIFHTAMIWISFFLMTYWGFKAFPPTAHLGMEAGLTVFVFGALGFVIPSPGGMGTYHFFIVEALKLYGIDGADGFSFANILFFAIQIGCNALFGFAAIFILPLLNKKSTIEQASS